MKIVLSIIVFVALMLFVGRTTISVSPFSIHMERPWIVVGIILLVLAIGQFSMTPIVKVARKLEMNF